jgi:serine phosphatase RsbU (regulator of sigma subunit)
VKKLIFLFLIFITTSISAQFADKNVYLIDSLDLKKINQEDLLLLDSIISAYHKTELDSSKIVLLSFLSEQLSDQEIWPKYNKLMFDLSEKKLKNINPSQKQLKKYYLDYKNRALNNFGYLNLMLGDIETALKYYDKSKKVLEQINDQQGLAAYYNSIGYIYINQGSIKKGLEFLLQSLKIKEELNDLPSLATSLTNIGYVYKNQNEYNKALEFYQKSLQIRQQLKDKAGIALCLGHLGSLYNVKKDYDTAFEYYQKAYLLSLETNDQFATAHLLQNIGDLKDLKKESKEALKYYNESLTIRRQINDLEGIGSVLHKIGETHFKNNNIKEAFLCANESMSIAKKLNYPSEIANSAGLLQKIYRHQKNWKASLDMLELQMIMKDSIKNEETQKAAIKQQMQYVYEKEKLADSLEFATQQAIKDLAINESRAKIEVQKAESKILYGGIFILVLLVAAALWAFRSKKRDNEIISLQKDEVEIQKVLVENKNKEIVDSINYAKRIQSAILPPDNLVKKYLKNSFILYKPKDIVAGDFYWMETISAETGVLSDESPILKAQHSKLILFAAADCTGHGVPGAMVSVVCNGALNRSVREYGLTIPGEILDKSREIVIQEFEKSDEDVKDGMDIALCVLENNQLSYAGANNPLWIIRKGEIIEIKANKQPIGKFDNPTPYTTHNIELEKGDTIYLFSDGYVDQFGGEKSKKYKAANFRKLLLSIQNETMDKQQQLINIEFENWRGNLDQIDDVCVIGVRV